MLYEDGTWCDGTRGHLVRWHKRALGAMAQEGTLADSAVVLATANAFNVEMQIVSADSPISPTSRSPSQTIFLGIVADFHYVSTANIDEPQVISQVYGGTTNNGMSLMHTDCVHCLLTWLSNFYENNNLH